MNLRRGAPLLAVLFVLLVSVWIMATPPSAGPDEPTHAVRAAGLVRGMLDGDRVPGTSTYSGFDLPATIGFPDPGCYAFQPEVPATCATSLDPPPGNAELGTRATDYPIWGHLAAGTGSLLPRSTHDWSMRLFDALLPAALIVGSLLLAARRGWAPFGATVLAVTPIVWFMLGVVNPSGTVIAGGIAVWSALLALSLAPAPASVPGGSVTLEERSVAAERPATTARATAWLLAIGWAAMVLPRRDGLVYASLVVALAILIVDHDIRRVLRRIGRGPLVVIAVSTLATLAWAWRSQTNASMALFAAPLTIVAAAVARRVWRSPLLATRGRRAAAIGGVAALIPFVMLAVMSRRSSGFDRGVLRATIGQTGLDLTETIGVLGWLDTPVPTPFVYLWVIGLGLLAGAVVVTGTWRLAGGAAAVLGVGIAASWTLSMLQNDPSGLYWQGRYYVPLLVGVPLVLGAVRLDRAQSRRIGVIVASIGLIVANVALATMMRRFGVGLSGSMNPLDWNTYDTVVPPVVLLVMHLAASVGLLAWATTHVADDPSRSVSDTNRDGSVGINVVGYHHAASGLGAIAREIHTSLVAAGVPCVAVDVAATGSPTLRPPAPIPATLHSITIAVVTAPQLPGALDALPEVRAAQQRLIGYWFWELADVPDEHRYAIGLVDEIWTPTTFVHDAYAAAVDGSTPVRRVPTRIERPEIDAESVAAWRSTLLAAPAASGSDHDTNHGSDEPTVLFVASLDLFSVVERKNPFGVIEAFRRAFPDGRSSDGRGVRLVIKTLNGDQRPDDLQRILDAAGGDPSITVVDRYVTDVELDALIAAADVYVSLHRSEGLGLHLATAMWVDTPVLATRWSGNLDLMDDESAALVGARLIAVTNGHGAYPDSSQWADPDLDQAAAWMTRLADDCALRDSIAGAARSRMEAQPARAEVGAAIAALVGVEPARLEEHALVTERRVP
ncbi:MAG: DUF2142 domain-containing protein [Ilumatobacter sp.]|uniref:DUF2142 domain-containing protein n=1 Tax=Ilumatobacter sp. TaxID=1967498 RepID=UPI003918CC16